MKKEDFILTQIIQKIVKLLPGEISKETGIGQSKRICQSKLTSFFKQVQDILLNSKYIEGTIDQQTIQDIESLTIELFGIDLIHNVSYPEVVDIKDRLSSSHFHICGNTITDAENISSLSGFNKQLSKNHILGARIDKLFQDLTIASGRALLEQMQLLPKKGNLVLAMDSFENRTQIRELTIEYILLNILINSDHCHKTMIARSLANSLNIDFDAITDKYMIYRESHRELKLS